MVDRPGPVLLEDVLEKSGLRHVEGFEAAGGRLGRKRLDVGGDDVVRAVFPAQGLEKLGSDLSGRAGDDNAGGFIHANASGFSGYSKGGLNIIDVR